MMVAEDCRYRCWAVDFAYRWTEWNPSVTYLDAPPHFHSLSGSFLPSAGQAKLGSFRQFPVSTDG